MEPLGHLNTMEIVKVERQSPRAGNKWLIFDQSRKHIETRGEAPVSPRVCVILCRRIPQRPRLAKFCLWNATLFWLHN